MVVSIALVEVVTFLLDVSFVLVNSLSQDLKKTNTTNTKCDEMQSFQCEQIFMRKNSEFIVRS